MIIKVYRWYGGKIRVANDISLLMPEHRAYYEPFMGSASVMLNHPRSELEVINDLDAELSFFMKTLADREKGKELTEKLCRLWYGREWFEEALRHKKERYRGLSDIGKACMIYVLISQSFNATRKSFSKSAYKDTNAYRADIMFNIPKAYERLQGVHVLNMNGIDMLRKISEHKNAFAFCDPPYRRELRGEGAGDVYGCELPHREQVRMLKTMRVAKCKIMLCGYRSKRGTDLYDTYLLPYGWHCYKLADLVKSCQSTKKKDIGQEFIWVNYELPPSAKYVISLKEYGSI